MPPGQMGNPYTKAPNTSAMVPKTIANSYYAPGAGPGEVVHGVNTFTGQPAYTVPLGDISCRGKVSYSLVLAYGGPTKPVVQSNNLRAPVSWVGLGFSLQMPFVAVNHKGTFTDSDDVYFCNLGRAGGGQLLRHPATGEFFLASDPAVRIEAQYNATLGSPLYGQIEAWVFTTTDGTKYWLGQKDGVVSGSERTVFCTGGLVQFSPFSAKTPFIYRWDAWKITDNSNLNAIYFSWQKFGYDLGGNPNPTSESYPSAIYTQDKAGAVMESWGFTLEDKAADEWVSDGGPGADVVFTETKALKELQHTFQGPAGIQSKYTFEYAPNQALAGNKRTLSAIGIWEMGSNIFITRQERLKRTREWAFTYELTSHWLLKTVTRPDGGTDAYTYASTPAVASIKQNPKVFKANFSLKKTALPVAANTNESYCDERFCYLQVKEGDNADNTHVQVIPHTGTYFDENTANHLVLEGSITNAASQSAGARSIELIPRGDDLLWVDKFDSKLSIYSWDGTRFVIRDNLSWPGPFGPNGGIEVIASSGYFLVWKKGISVNGSNIPGKARIYMYRKDPKTGAYAEINAGKAPGACVIDNKDFGAPVKDAGDGCMTFKDASGSTDQLLVAAGANMFHIVHKPTGTLYSYVLSQSNQWADISGSFPRATDMSFQETANGNRWRVGSGYRHTGLVLGPDYLIVKTKYDSRTYGWLSFFHFDGANYRYASTHQTAGTDVEVHSSGGYFLTIDRYSRDIRYWKQVKAVSPSAAVSFTYYTLFPALAGDLGNAQDYLVRLHPDWFSLEFWKKGKLTTQTPIGVPLIDPSTKNYRTYQYRVQNGKTAQAAAGVFADLIDPTHPAPTVNLFNLSFSYSDPFAIGMSLRRADNGAICPDENTACNLGVFTLGLRSYVTSGGWVTGPKMVTFNQAVQYLNLSHVAMSSASRIGMLSFLDKGSKIPLYQLYANNGQNFDEPDATPMVVTRTTSSAGLDGAAKNNLAYDFAYNVANSTVPLDAADPSATQQRFNVQTQSLQNSNCRITQSGVGGAQSWYQFDYPGNPKRDGAEWIAGRVYKTASLNSSNQALSITTAHFAGAYCRGPALERPWPPSLLVRRVDSVKTETFDPGRNKKSSVQWIPAYNDGNGQPFFTVKQNKANADYVVGQTLFNSQELPTQTITYRLNARPANLATTAVNTASLPSTSIPYSQTGAISAKKQSYDAVYRYLPATDSVWRDIDESAAASDAALKAGQAPAYNLAENWIEASRILARNEFAQIIEMTSIRNLTPLQETRSTLFYEGPRSDRIGAVSNAGFADCKIFSAEDGTLTTGAYHDGPAQWLKKGSANSPDLAHSGLWSAKVVDDLGPTGILIPGAAATMKFGYRISAWFLIRGSGIPVLKVERRNATGTLIETHAGALAPDDKTGYLQPGIWQRYEVNLPYGKLSAGGVFQTAAKDYLVVSAGTGAKAGDPNRIVYVDDLVVVPDNSEFEVSGYDYRGWRTTSMDSRYRMRRFDYNSKGDVTGIRDDRGRIYTQTGVHRMGENQ